jgi:hypothetical protein
MTDEELQRKKQEDLKKTRTMKLMTSFRDLKIVMSKLIAMLLLLS